MQFNSIVEYIFNYGEEKDVKNKLCIVDKKSEYTYAFFVESCKKLANYFGSIGVKNGDKVIVEGYQKAEFLIVEFALHLLSAIFVPLENKCSDDKVKEILINCESNIFVSINKRNTLNDQYNNITYDEIFDSIDTYAPIDKIMFPNADSISEILFSTGTTGKEKGIVLTHKNDVAVAENIMYGTKMEKDNVELIPSPLNHSHGLRSVYANLINGSAIVIIENVMDMKTLYGFIDKYGVNSMDLVPTALSVIIMFSKNKLGEYKDKLRYIEFGSAPMSDTDKKKIKELLPKVPLYNFYGSTESGRTVVYNFNDTTCKDKCIGKPTKNSIVVIVDDEFNEIASSKDNTGRIATCGDMNMLCYYKDDEETNKAKKGDFIYSNDEAYFDEDGDIILLGRIGDVISIGGKKVSPLEIENVAKELPYIKDCACIGIDDKISGQVPKLFVVLDEGIMLNVKEIQEFLMTKLETFKVPNVIVKIDKIPRTFNGKILRRELKSME